MFRNRFYLVVLVGTSFLLSACSGGQVVEVDDCEWCEGGSGKCRVMGLDMDGICAVGEKKSKNKQHAKTIACEVARSELAKGLAYTVKAGAAKAAESVTDGERETYSERTAEGFANKMVERLNVSAIMCPKGKSIREDDGSYTVYALAVLSAADVAGALKGMAEVKELSEAKAAAIRNIAKEVSKELDLND